MRISLRYRMPAAVILIFAVFLAAAFAGYRLYAGAEMRRGYDLLAKRLNEIGARAVADFTAGKTGASSVSARITALAKEEGVRIAVSDSEQRRLFYADGRGSYGFTLTNKDFHVAQNGEIYFVEVAYPLTLSDLFPIDRSARLRAMLLVLLCLAVLALIGYFYQAIVRPLTALHRSLERVDFHHLSIQPAKIVRHDELGELSDKFLEMLTRLDDARRRQTEMLASVSHDLKTPLTSILGFVERLKAAGQMPEQRRAEYYDIIHRKALEIKDLLEQFHEMARADAVEDGLSSSVINLRAFFDQVVADVGAEAKAADCDLQAANEAGETEEIAADPRLLSRVFTNLLDNAFRYGDRPLTIWMTCGRQGKTAVFTVEDSGPGVPDAELESIFARFYRLETSRSRNTGGSGLGLAICRSIVARYGGEIRAFRSSMGGLGVAFTLPLHKSSSFSIPASDRSARIGHETGVRPG